MKYAELTWEDINTLERIINNVHYEFRNGIGEKSFGEEVLNRFLDTKDDSSEKPNNHLEGMDEAAEKYANYHPKCFHKPIAEAFKAGAEWAFGQFESMGTFPIEDTRGGYWPTEYFVRKK